MRKSVIVPFVLLLLLLFLCISSAEESGTTGDPARSGESHKGDKGLSFSVSGLSSVGIGQYEGGIGGKYWMSKKLAIISSLGVSAQKTTVTAYDVLYTDTKTSQSRFSIFAGIEDHFFIKSKISPYFGGGIRFTTSPYTRYPSIPVDHPPSGTTKKMKQSIKSFGIRGFCGIEFFFADWVSLAGQYQIDYFYQKSTVKTTLVGGQGVIQPREQKSTATTLGMGTSALVATFYIW